MRLQNSIFSLLIFGFCPVWAEDKQVPWFDVLHDDISHSVNVSAVWLDDFFGHEEYQSNEMARGGARVQLGIEPRSRDLMEFESRVRIRVKLPKLKNRVDLVFSDYDEELEKAPIKAAQNEVLQSQNRFNLALRWSNKKGQDSFWSNRIGIGRKAQPFARTQYTSRGTLSDTQRYRWLASAYFYQNEGFGSHLGLQLEQDLNQSSVVRLDNDFFFRDESDDWLWQHNLYNMTQLSDSSALISGIYVDGLTQPNYQVNEYLLSVRWRKNALREWLFFEVEPFVLWRRDESFDASYGLAMRIEGYFGHY
ncbi:MAG: hypothetical protein ACFHVJ_03080 [Aestuariibacter sp.]